MAVGRQPGTPDPPVFDRQNESGVPWQATGQPLSQFLLHMTVFEAIWTARHVATTCWPPTENLHAVLAPLRPLPMPAWRWPAPGSRLYAADGLLAFTAPDDITHQQTADTANRWALILGAQHPEHLHHARQIPGINWDT